MNIGFLPDNNTALMCGIRVVTHCNITACTQARVHAVGLRHAMWLLKKVKLHAAILGFFLVNYHFITHGSRAATHRPARTPFYHTTAVALLHSMGIIMYCALAKLL